MILSRDALVGIIQARLHVRQPLLRWFSMKVYSHRFVCEGAGLEFGYQNVPVDQWV